MSDTPDALVHGGMWDRQRLLGGQRLVETFDKDESFILWDLEVVGEVPVEENKTTPKVELTVSKLDDPDNRFTVGALGKAIVELAELDRQDGDLPAVVHYDEVPTKRNLQPAVVIIAERQYVVEAATSSRK